MEDLCKVSGQWSYAWWAPALTPKSKLKCSHFQAVPVRAHRECGEASRLPAGQPLLSGAGTVGAGKTPSPFLRICLRTRLAWRQQRRGGSQYEGVGMGPPTSPDDQQG